MHNVNYMCRIMCDTTWDAIGENEHECAVACTKIRFYYNPTDRYFVNFNL